MIQCYFYLTSSDEMKMPKAKKNYQNTALCLFYLPNKLSLQGGVFLILESNSHLTLLQIGKQQRTIFVETKINL